MTDNVRKVFDLLGVEPNEKFKIKAIGKENALYYLNEKLTGYLWDERGKDYIFIVDWLLPSVLINPECIIKLPKKKKLRDLTKEKALEVLDMIETHLEDLEYKIHNRNVIFQMPEDEDIEE